MGRKEENNPSGCGNIAGDKILTDALGRQITYLRISVTDLCNYRCTYCMPPEGVAKHTHAQVLSFEEILEIADACVSTGVTKIRLTGGEPTVRRGIVTLCKQLKALPGLSALVMTTNASGLAGTVSEQTNPDTGRKTLAQALRDAGVDRLNISLDTLDAERFRMISRTGSLADVISGIEAAKEAGFTDLKYNVVLMGGVNDDEIPAFIELTRDTDCTVRFIELMPVGESVAWDNGLFLSADTVRQRCPELQEAGTDGVSRLYRVPGYRGAIGLIRTMSEPFCAVCSRMRLTADGMLKPCLHRGIEIPLRGLHGAELKDAIREAVRQKPANCGIAEEQRSESGRGMYAIGG